METATHEEQSTLSRAENYTTQRHELVELLAPVWKENPLKRPQLADSLTGILLRETWPVDVVKETLKAISIQAGDSIISFRLKAVDGADRRLKANKGVAGWPSFRKNFGDKLAAELEACLWGDAGAEINAGIQNLTKLSPIAWDALQKANDPPHLFRYGDTLSRLESDDEGNPVLRELTASKLKHELARAANWYVETNDGGGGKNRKDARPTADMVQDMLAYREPPLPVLRRITKTPVFTPDGKLHTTPGYHESACIYYAPTDGFSVPSVSESPTLEEVGKAKEWVDDIICDFPFVSAADRAHAVALLLLPFVRDLIDGPTPIHLIESPSPGSGKSLLADVLLRPSVGNSISILTHTGDDDEMRKRITSLLREGRSVVMLDNLTRMLDSGVLAGAITGDRWSDRILGASAMLNLPVRCIWIVTGNNPSMSMEIARRSVRVRLDAGIERGWLREGFRHENLRAWVKEQRGAIIWAALTLISHWIASGKPTLQDRFIGSFESWSGVMGGILHAAGYEGFLENLDEFYEAADAEADGLRVFVKAWWEQFGSDTVTAAHLFPLAAEIGLCDEGGAERAQKISFGKQLTRLRDRIFDGYRVVSAGQFRHAAQWKLLPSHPPV